VIALATLRPHIAAMHNAHNTDHSRIKIMEAIARGMLVTARYNGQTLTLAPHALFARRGDLFVSALNFAKNWRSPDERRLGYFKLAGLAAVEVTREPFEALPNAASLLSQAEDELLLAVA
jgi:hypothetical protein